MTQTIREFKMEVTERATVPPSTTKSLGTSSSVGRTSVTIQIPNAPRDQGQTIRSVSVERPIDPARK